MGRPSKRDKWLRERAKLITASDAAAILGLDPWRGPLAVFADKRGLIEREDNDYMLFGRLLEDDVAEGYNIKTGRKILKCPEYEIARHKDIPWLGCTLDRRTQESELAPRPNKILSPGPVPLELKTVGYLGKKEWTEEPPLHYQVQLMIQMEVTGADWGSLAVLIGGQLFKWADIQRHQRFIDSALPKLEQFWIRVKENDPPPDEHPSAVETLRVLYAEDNGETVELGEETLQQVEAWAHLKARQKEFEAEAKEREAEIIASLRDNSVGILPDGSFLRAVTQHIQERTQMVRAHTRRPIYWKRGTNG
jgi:putative phage-type endonuclease